MRASIAWTMAAVAAVAVVALGLAASRRSDPSSERLQDPQASSAIERPGTPAVPAPGAPGRAGMHVAIEPESGELTVASPEQRKSTDHELEESLSRSADGLYEEFLPDGTVKVNLQGRFQSASVAVIGADGTLHTTCVENHDGAQNVLHGAHCKRAQPEEK